MLQGHFTTADDGHNNLILGYFALRNTCSRSLKINTTPQVIYVNRKRQISSKFYTLSVNVVAVSAIASENSSDEFEQSRLPSNSWSSFIRWLFGKLHITIIVSPTSAAVITYWVPFNIGKGSLKEPFTRNFLIRGLPEREHIVFCPSHSESHLRLLKLWLLPWDSFQSLHELWLAVSSNFAGGSLKLRVATQIRFANDFFKSPFRPLQSKFSHSIKINDDSAVIMILNSVLLFDTQSVWVIFFSIQRWHQGGWGGKGLWSPLENVDPLVGEIFECRREP